MARQPRIDYPGAWHHITAHAHSDDPLFRNAADARFFLRLVGDSAERFGQETHAYCLMTNHYHLLVRSGDGKLSRAMAYLNGRFAQHMVATHNLRGSPFSGRFHNELIDNDSYLLTATRYIARNPVDAGMVRDPREYRWSSFRFYDSGDAHPWLCRSTVTGIAGGQKELIHFVDQPLPSDKRFHAARL